MNPAYPWRIGADGRTVLDGDEDHLRSMIEQLLLTNRGERVNRLDFGGSLSQLTFAPNSAELAATLQLTLQANIQRYLADVVTVGGLAVKAVDERLIVELQFQRSDATAATATITLSGGGSA